MYQTLDVKDDLIFDVEGIKPGDDRQFTLGYGPPVADPNIVPPQSSS